MVQGTRVKQELAATAGEWFYVCCHCIVDFGRRGVSFTYECGACGNNNLRFMHTLENERDGRQIQVGIECARAMLASEDWRIPALAQNEVKRKERWRVRHSNPGRCVVTEQDLIDKGKL